MFRSRVFSGGALFLSFALIVGACGGGGAAAPTTTAAPSTAAPTTTAAPSTAAPTTATTGVEPVTLTVWDSFIEPVDTPVIEKLDQEFEAAHPGVTVDRQGKSFEEVDTTIKLALSSDKGPDVAVVNQGNSSMGALVKAGLLISLTPYYNEFGWSKFFPPSLVAANSYTADGKTYGEGNLYAISPMAEVVGVFYRKDIFQKLGLDVPKSLDEFDALLAKLKDAGEVPITFGNLDRWPIMHIFSSLQGAYLGADHAYLDDLTYARGNVTWDNPANLAAIAKFKEWADAGYYTPGYEGIGYDDSTAQFNNGEGAMMLTGNWIASTFAAGPYGDQIGFFLLPPEVEGVSTLSTGGTNVAYAIGVNSKNPELAAEYIAWMMSGDAARAWQAAGVVPVAADIEAAANDTSMFGDLVRAWGSLVERNAIGAYSDKPSPGTYDVEAAAFQKLLAGRITPAEVIQALDEDYIAFLKEKGVR